MNVVKTKQMAETITALIVNHAERQSMFTNMVNHDALVMQAYKERTSYEELTDRVIDQTRDRETSTLYDYVTHIYNGGTTRDILVSSRNTSMNKQFMSDLDACDRCIRRTVRGIASIQQSIEHNILTLNHNPPPSLDMDKVESGNTGEMERYLELLTIHRDTCIDLQKQSSSLRVYKERLEKANLERRLRDRAIAFDMTWLVELPEDVVNYVILEFLGDDFIEQIRRRSVAKNHFRVARTQLSDLLWKWNKRDLLRFEKQRVFLRYSIDNYGFSQNETRRTVSKTDLIERMLEGRYKCSFYPFQRDVFILTSLIAERKRELRKENKRILHAKNVNSVIRL